MTRDLSYALYEDPLGTLISAVGNLESENIS
jgi:hypothetical protein